MANIDHSVGLRLQAMPISDQGAALAKMAEARSGKGFFTPKGLDDLFAVAGLPGPSKVSNLLTTLGRLQYVRPAGGKGKWKLTPAGRSRADEVLSDMDAAALAAEAASYGGTVLGGAVHTVVPASFAPPGLLNELRGFLADHPFETNVFAMTRFPSGGEDSSADPIPSAIEAARAACAEHGLQMHLASDRAIKDELWANVAAHMWASRYGVALFEDRMKRGLNYNLTIEVGSMLMTGRRCALLKDNSIAAMPTDLVGQIYKPVDLSDLGAVADTVHAWIRDDLGLGRCRSCPVERKG